MAIFANVTAVHTYLIVLLQDWDALRDDIMAASLAETDLVRKVELSRVAAAYEYCADGLRKVIGEPLKYTEE